MNNMRRNICKSLGMLFGSSSLIACAQSEVKKPEPTYTDEEQRRRHKFRGINGYGLEVDIFKGYPQGTECLVNDDLGNHITGGMGVSTTGSIRPTGLFKFVEASLYEPNVQRRPLKSGKQGVLIPGGDLIGQWTIPVADRIPDALLDDLRRDPKGMLRIKIRLHREGVLLGWDIQRRPGFDPKKRDVYGEAVYVAPVHSFAGGDFQEAKIYNGKVVRKGWYIHPKTGQRIETDF